VYRILLYLVVLTSTLPQLVHADTAGNGEIHFFGDMGQYFTAPARWDSGDWTKFGLIAGGIYLVSETVDDYWKDEMVNEEHPYYYNSIEKIGDAWGDGRLSGPFMLGVYAYGRWADNTRYVHASQDMLQSVVYTGLMTQALKQVFSRDRPNAAEDESGWFGSGVSFPSGHTSVAFAVSRSFLNSLDNPSIGTQVLFYGLATSTALARTYDNAHWASDVVAGAVLGIYTADFVSARNRKHREGHVFAPYIGNNTIGFQMIW
jgi:membrane-associated phospholipid phosphatase